MKKIAILNSAVEADLLGALLKDQEIPHLIRSYHDSAYDGLFQKSMGWGHVEGPDEVAEEIHTLLDRLRSEAAPPPDAE